jgi:hypothetical protein
VRLRQIHDVDVIADARAVRRRIIRAVNLALLRLAERDLEHVRDEMGFDAMMLAELLARAGGIEVAERDELQPVQLLIPLEDFLEHQLGFAVRIDRALRQIFGHRHAIRRAVGRAGGAEHEFLHAARHGGIQQVQPVRDIVAKILRWVRHGFADQRVGGEVENGFRLRVADGVL